MIIIRYTEDGTIESVMEIESVPEGATEPWGAPPPGGGFLELERAGEFAGLSLDTLGADYRVDPQTEKLGPRSG